MGKEVRKNIWKNIEDFNLSTKELALLTEVYNFAKYNGFADSFENSIKEIIADSSFFKKLMNREVMAKKYGDDFEFAKLMVTKFNPNTILAFKLSMLLPKKEWKENDPAKFNKILSQRQFFVNYFINDCDLSLAAFPNVKVSTICEMGFMKSSEIAELKAKRNLEVNKNMPKHDYERGTYTLEKY